MAPPLPQPTEGWLVQALGLTLGGYNHGLCTGQGTAQADMKTCVSEKVLSTSRYMGYQRWSDLGHPRGRTNAGTYTVLRALCLMQGPSTIHAPSELWFKSTYYLFVFK